MRRGVADFQARQQAELDRLAGQRIGAGDHRLARDHGRDRRQHHHRNARPVGVEQKERTGDRLRVGEDERALTQIVERQRRQNEA